MHCPLLSNFYLVFRPLKLRLETFYCNSKRKCWHLHGSNPRSTSLRYRLRLGHDVLNLNKRTFRLCSCGGKGTEGYLLLNCILHSALRVDLVKSVLLKEDLKDLLSSVIYDHPRLLQILLCGPPSLKPTTKLQIYIMLSLNI